ncbi:hypothetical protein [Dulcicalothrix desertica]|uniref:hypothetical protein n=1 Tax=Dulcicalothrix desertica TaxID=32056 RepID=UPI000F8D77DB|nr:hypothetical protein [Dulcicalothrix desertica]TWH40286.1 hypothetical protein CAL7102_09593 [Dulcicalothrix desertica PCC 7102]
MSRLIANFGNPNNWESIYNTNLVGADAGNGRYFPIQETTVPLLLENHILAISTSSQNASNKWKSAGFLNYLIRTGLVVGGTPNTRFGSGYRINLNAITLLILPQLSNEYSISINIHYWIQDVAINIWQYTGDSIDSTDNLIEEIRDVNLASIERKIDDISTYGGS